MQEGSSDHWDRDFAILVPENGIFCRVLGTWLHGSLPNHRLDTCRTKTLPLYPKEQARSNLLSSYQVGRSHATWQEPKGWRSPSPLLDGWLGRASHFHNPFGTTMTWQRPADRPPLSRHEPKRCRSPPVSDLLSTWLKTMFFLNWLLSKNGKRSNSSSSVLNMTEVDK